MAREFAKSFYKSKKWQACRNAYIQQRILIDGGMCERCKQMTGYIVHHKIKLTPNNINNPDVILNHNNLEWLCHACHDEEHYLDMHGTERKQYAVFDVNGCIIPNTPHKK